MEKSLFRTCMVVFLLVVALVSCTSSNYMVGTDQSYMSLEDQRKALQAVEVHAALPENCTIMGEVDAARCHRRFTQKSPTPDLVVIDMQVAAYARGADGICDVTVTQRSALLEDCWYMLDGRATMFKRNKP